MGILGVIAAIFAGIVTVAIVYQVVNGRNTDSVAGTLEKGLTAVTGDLFK